jgi:Sigma-70, region 4
MSPIRALAPDQRAVLELLLRQGRSYPELSELLGIPESAVRTRAHGALAQLAPDRPAPVGEDGAVADWLLGQQDEDEAAATRAAIARTPAWRAWAEEVAARLAKVEGAELPEVPAADEDDAPAATERGGGNAAAPAARHKPATTGGGGTAAAKRRPRPVRDGAAGAGKPRPRPVRDRAKAAAAAGPGAATAAAAGRRDGAPDEPSSAARPALSRRSSRLGGAVLIGVLAALVAVVLVVFVFRGDDEAEPPASRADATPTATATPQVVSEVVMEGVGNKAQGLMRVFRRDQDGRLVFALAADKLPPNRGQEVYAVWFTRKGGTPRNLGFSQTQVGKDGVFTTGGPQQGQERDFAKWLVDYDTVVVARASASSASAKRPGEIVLRGTLPGGQE